MKYKDTLIVGGDEYGREYILQPDKYLIEYRRETTDEEIKGFLDEYELKPLDPQRKEKPDWEPPSERPRWYVPRLWVESAAISPDALLEDDRVVSIAPVYYREGQTETSALAPAPNVLVIETSEGEPSDELIEKLEQMGLRYNRSISRLLGRFSHFDLDNQEKLVYDLRAQVEDEDEVLSADFNYRTFDAYGTGPTDALWAQQWNMDRIGAEAGWQIEQGSSDVVIAIIDSGCDLTHPDLVYTDPAAHFNVEELRLGMGPPFNAQPVSPHGTAVAGIAAAVHNSIGVAGIAPNSPIMPAVWDETSEGAAMAINWAVLEGARVVNMSFKSPPSPVLEDAVSNAIHEDVVLVAASGNTNQPLVDFPAAYPGVIAVGAIDAAGQRPQVLRGLSPWGSNFGGDLDVVAPGIDIPTTDMRGNAGYNITRGQAGDYNLHFERTSAAAPHVAGLAALILSRCPDLTGDQVQQVICESCERLNGYTYVENPSHPHGEWNHEIGYGLINIDGALELCGNLENEVEENDVTESTAQNGDNGSGGASTAAADVPFDLDAIDMTQGTLLIRFVARPLGGPIEADMILTWVPDDPTMDPIRDIAPIARGPLEGPSDYFACVNSTRTLKSVVGCMNHVIE